MSGIVRDLLVNPADPTARYIAYTNGYIQALGTALPIDQVDFRDAVSANKAPTWFGGNGGPLRAVVIIDWGTPSGYTLDQWGLIYPWGGVDPCPGGPGAPFTDAADYFFGGNGGFEVITFGFAWDLAMNPAGDGTGYFLTLDGDVHAFGTGVTAVAHSAFLTGGAASTRFFFDWSSKRYWVGDNRGRIWGKNGGNNRGVESFGAGTFLPAGDGSYDAAGTFVYSRDCVGLVLYDVTADAKGWMLDSRGRVWGVGGADPATGFKPTLNAPNWVDLAVIDDGQGANPLRLTMVSRSGSLQEWVSSTKPTVEVVTPDDPTSDTTRPFVTWTYIDPQGDAQLSYEVKVFDSATVAGMGFDPDTSTPTFTKAADGNATRVQVNLDLANDTYRAYVRATDTSNLTSDWDYLEWEQDVTAPAVPTVTATAGEGLDGIDLALHVEPMGLDPDARLIVQFTDTPADDDSWATVAGGFDITPDVGGDATVTDLQAPFGIGRTYRAQTYLYDPVTEAWIGSGWGATDSATLGPLNLWALTHLEDGVISDGEWELQPDVTRTTPTDATVFWADSRADPIVVDDGEARFPDISVSMFALTGDARSDVEELLDSKQVLLLRSPFGDAWYVKSIADEPWALIHAVPLATESTGVRDSHDVKLRLQSVARPATGPTSGPLAET